MKSLITFLNDHNYKGRLSIAKDNHLLHVEVGHRYLLWDTEHECPVSIDYPYDGFGG